MEKTGKKLLTALLAAAMAITIILPATGAQTTVTVQAASSSKAYTETKDGSGIFSNGTYKYYTKSDDDGNYYLMKKTISSGKTKKLKTFKMTGAEGCEDSYTVSAVKNGNVYITRCSTYYWKNWTYVYNIKKAKVIKKYGNVCIEDVSGNYVITTHQLMQEFGPQKISLYKLTSSGMKKVKTLSTKACSAEFVSGKVYYAVYQYADDASIYLSRIKVYRCSKSGKSKKLLRSYVLDDDYYIEAVTFKSSYCKVTYFKNGGNTKTKKVKYN